MTGLEPACVCWQCRSGTCVAFIFPPRRGVSLQRHMCGQSGRAGGPSRRRGAGNGADYFDDAGPILGVATLSRRPAATAAIQWTARPWQARPDQTRPGHGQALAARDPRYPLAPRPRVRRASTARPPRVLLHFLWWAVSVDACRGFHFLHALLPVMDRAVASSLGMQCRCVDSTPCGPMHHDSRRVSERQQWHGGGQAPPARPAPCGPRIGLAAYSAHTPRTELD